jgi:hypothetical protein
VSLPATLLRTVVLIAVTALGVCFAWILGAGSLPPIDVLTVAAATTWIYDVLVVRPSWDQATDHDSPFEG